MTITLSATAASGFSVTKTTYKVDGGAEQTYSAPFTISSEGDHTLVVQSTDNAGVFEAPKTINVKIQANRAPTANAGGPYRVTAGGTVTLNGSGSDPDSDVLTYNWDLDNNGSFETAGQTPSFSAAGLSAGTSRTAVLEVCDPKNACATAQATVNVVGALAITTDTLSNGTVGVAYSATLQASGGTTPYTWSIPAGTLPAGLTLDAASGVISGTPSAAGISSLNVSVNDGGSQTASKALSLTIHLASNPVPTVNSLSPSSTPAGGPAFTLTVTGTGFVQGSKVHWNGSERPTTDVSATELKAEVSANDIATTSTANVTVVNPTPGGGTSPAPAPFSIPQGNRASTANAGGPYGVVAGGSITLSGSGSDPDNDPLTYAWDLDNDGTFETTGQSPTFSAAGLSAGTSRMVVREVCDNKNLCIRSAPATVNVLSALRITTESPLPSGTVGVAYSTRLSATGGTEPYTWTIASGELPPGLALNGSTGVISGTPTGAGTYAFTVRVTDSSQVTATKQFTLSSPPTEGTPGQPYPPTPVQPVPPTPPGGGEAPPCTNYMLAAGSDLPPGMRLDPVTGTLSGTPTSGGSFKIVVECTYNANQTATADFTITILNPKPAIQSVSPNSATAGGPALTLTVNGNGFVNATDPTKASVVQWNGTSRKTTFVSATQLTAEIGTADVAAAGTAKVTVVNPAPGGGTSNELSFTITQATPTNRPPVAKAGADQAIKEGETVTLNAGESSDPDADALSHKWTLVSHSGPDVSLSSATAASPTFATTDNGSYTFRVEVSDGKGGTATDEVVVTVTNVAPTVKAGADAALCSGQTLGLKADVADPGAKDGPWSFSIDWGDGSPSNTGSSPSQGTGVVTGSHQYFAAKTYTVKVCVTDKDGGQHCDELKLEIKTAAAELGEIRDELAAIVRENPRTPLADKIEDALAKVEVALTELNKRPPDRVAAVGNVEGAVGDLEAAVKDRLLAAAEGRPLMDCLAGTARLLAQTALDEAVARSGNRSALEEARRSLARGDERRAAGAFKEAVAAYKDALSKATGA